MTHKNSTQVINLQRKWGFLNFPLFPSFRILPSPPHFHCFLLNKSLFRCNFLDFILITSLDSCKEHPSHLFATEMRFCKFSIVSFFSNWFYSSERKPGGAGNFQIFEKKRIFFFKFPKTLSTYASKSYFNSLNFNKTQINKLPQTLSPSDFHCFLLNKSQPWLDI